MNPEKYKAIDAPFTDYNYWEFDDKSRVDERIKFVDDLIYSPNFSYPRLDFLLDDKKIVEKKTILYESILELEEAKWNSVNFDELELYASSYEFRLKKIMLVEASRNMRYGDKTAESQFIELGHEIYGYVDKSMHASLICSEQNKLKELGARDKIDENIILQLTEFYNNLNIEPGEQRPLLDSVEMNKLSKFVEGRYRKIFDTIPKTGDDFYYDANQCCQIIEDCLVAGGLYNKGWRVIMTSSKLTPSTNGVGRAIYIPDNTKRNAKELKKLVAHEQEVHARRAENGMKSNLRLLSTGTANYADVEEGLGVILECAIEGNFDNSSFERAKWRYIAAGLAEGVNDAPRDARQVYEILWRMIVVDSESIVKAKDQALEIVINAFRGTNFATPGVYYPKLKVYYEGLVKNAELIKENIDSLDDCFDIIMSGKYNHTDKKESDLVLKLAR